MVAGGIERHHEPENQKMLGWRQAHHPWLHLTILEEAPAAPARVVIPVLQPHDGAGPAVRQAILQGCRDGFNRLPGPCPATIAVPAKLRTNRHAPWLAHGPMHRQLSRVPQGGGTSRNSHLFCSN